MRTLPSPVREHDYLAALPPPRQVPDAAATIRDGNEAAGIRLVVLDDDPTGSQTVHDVPVVLLTGSIDEVVTTVLATHAPAVFVLTNSRALDTEAAAELNHALAAALHRRCPDGTVRIVSRSDSTLRGHFAAETGALADAAAQAGRPYDGVLVCPAFPEAGRLTIDDVQWVRRDDLLIPAADTEYASDATFGYSEASLPEWAAARTGRAPEEVGAISLADLRTGGVDRVAGQLRAVTGGRVVVANAADPADLDVLCLAVQRAEATGTRLLYRTGPSFVSARAGLPPRVPLSTADLYPEGLPEAPGLVVAGSHVPLTNRQLVRARARHRLVTVEADAGQLLAGHARADAELRRCVARLTDALVVSDALLVTSRRLIRGSSPAESLSLARYVAAAVADIVAHTLDGLGDQALRYLVGKGGITAAELATRALGMRQAIVVGQLARGRLSVWKPLDGRTPGIPYVVFPGNVGSDATLANVLDILTGVKGEVP